MLNKPTYEELYQELLAASPTVIYRCEPFGQFAVTFISKNIINQMGYKPEDFTSNPRFWADHIHPDDRPQVFANLACLFEKGIHKHEYRFLHRDGSYRWMYDQLRLLRDSEGNPIEILGNWIDITDHKQMKALLQESEIQSKSLSQPSPTAQVIWQALIPQSIPVSS